MLCLLTTPVILQTGLRRRPNLPLSTRVLKDPQFWIAILLGPVVWIALWFGVRSGSPSGLTLALFFTGVLLYPIVEELAFRGFLQTWLLENPRVQSVSLGPVSLANLCTSVLFASFHMFNRPLLWAVLVFPPSLVFGYLRTFVHN